MKPPKKSTVIALVSVAGVAGLIALFMGEYVYAAILFVMLIALLFWGIKGQAAQPSSTTTVSHVDQPPAAAVFQYPDSVRAMLNTISSLGVDPSALMLFHADGPIGMADVADAMHTQLTAVNVTPWVLARKAQDIYNTMYEVGGPFVREHGDQPRKETVRLLAAEIIEICKLRDAVRARRSSQVPRKDPKDII